jgi:hypothetical protein
VPVRGAAGAPEPTIRSASVTSAGGAAKHEPSLSDGCLAQLFFFGAGISGKLPRMLEPRTDILPEPQRRLWPELAVTPADFILYGGTAIALRLGHRQSVDFDFFSFGEAVSQQRLKRVSYLSDADLLQSAPGTLSFRVDRGGPVRVSFFGPLRLGQVDAPEAVAGPGIAVASLRDLGGVKVAVVTQRAEARDYVDVHALLRAGISLPEMLAAAGLIYEGEFNPLIALKALAYHDDILESDLPAGARLDLAAAVASVNVAKLPVIEPYRRRPSR